MLEAHSLSLAGPLVNPLGLGDLGVPGKERRPAALTINTTDPRVRAILMQPELQRMLDLLQRKIRQIASQPVTAERVMDGLEGADGDGELGFAWFALIPALMPLVQKMMGGGASAGSGEGKVDASAIMSLVQKAMVSSESAPGSRNPSIAPGQGFTAADVMKMIDSIIAAQKQQPQRPTYIPPPPPGPQPAYAPVPSGPCVPPDVYNAAGGYCYNPQTQQATAPVPAAVPTAAKKPGKMRKAPRGAATSRRRGRRGMRDYLGAPPATSPGIATGLLLGIGGALAATGATIAAIRAH